MRKSLQKILLMVLMCSSVIVGYGQDRTITGAVMMDEDGSRLPGVNVILKGSNTGTTTDANGQYSISVPQDGVLIFSFIGFVTQEVSIGGRTVVDIRLASDITQLSEVVVTAVGVESERRSLGTSVATVRASDIADSRQTNVVNALTAKVAGVRIQSSSGMVGASSSIFIRGMTSFTASNQPLFVVDGIPIDNSGGGIALQSGVQNSNRAIDLNPDDIESMTVLKGPAAAVLYGSRAVAGAIIITTKKGGASRAKNTVSFTSNYNIVEVNKLPDYQNDYGQGINGVYNATSLDSWGPRITGTETVTNYIGQPEVLEARPDNVRKLFKQGSNMQNSLSIRGGNETSNFIFSYSNLKEDGIIKNNNMTRNTFKIAGNTEITKKLRAGASVTYFQTTSRRTPSGNQQSNPIFRGYIMPRSFDVYNYPYRNPNGTQTYFDSSTDNPLWTIESNTYNDKVDRMLASVDFAYDFTDWFNVTYKLGTDMYTHNLRAVDAVGAIGLGYTGASLTGGVQDETIFSQQTSSYLNLNAKKTFGDFNTTFLLGNEVNQSVIRDQGYVATGAAVNGFGQVDSYTTYFPFANTTGGRFVNGASANAGTRRLLGVYGQATVGYKSFIYLTATGRNDWSSTFAKGNNSYFYPSLSGSFIFTEAFPGLVENPVLQFGKLRFNVARVGREAPNYVTDTYFGVSNPATGFGPALSYPFRGVQAYTLSNAAGNPNIKPEMTTTQEVGSEFRLWNNKITLDVGYFSTRTTDIILAAPSSAASGYSSMTRNAGELKTNGIEVSIGFSPIKTTNFSWDISANWTRIRNNVIKIDPLVTSIALGGFTSPQTRLEAGKPYGIIVGNKLNRDAEGNLLITSTGAGAGQATFNTAAVDQIGDPNPDWTGGLTNTFSYKGFALSALIDVRMGGDIVERNLRDLRFRGVVKETGNREQTYIIPGVLRDPVANADGSPRALLVDGQTVPNTIAISAQNYWTSLYLSQGETMVFDASWLRLREVSLTYTLPRAMLAKTPFGMAQIAFTGRNLFLYAPNYPHLDPEVNSQGVSNSQGIAYNTFPQTRSYGVLLRLNF